MPEFSTGFAAIARLQAAILDETQNRRNGLREVTEKTLKAIIDRHGVYPRDVKWEKLSPYTIAKKGANTPRFETGAHSTSYQATYLNDGSEIFSNDPIEAIQEGGFWNKRTGRFVHPRPIILPEFRKAEEYAPEIFMKYLNLALSTL